MNWPKTLKKTKYRLALLELLQQAAHPLTAQAMYAQLHQKYPKLWLSTIYRCLEAFEAHRLVIKTHVFNTDQTVYQSTNNHHHYAMCQRCLAMMVLDECVVSHYQKQCQQAGFKILNHRIELFGLCHKCASD